MKKKKSESKNLKKVITWVSNKISVDFFESVWFKIFYCGHNNKVYIDPDTMDPKVERGQKVKLDGNKHRHNLSKS